MIRAIVDWIVLRVQERTGVAKCRFLPFCWGAALTLGFACDLFYGRNIAVSAFLTLWLLAAVYFDWQPQWKEEQEQANRVRAVVISKFRYSKFFVVMALLFFLLFLLNLVPPVRVLRLIEAALQTIASALALANTFPMTGPTLSERLRELLWSPPEPYAVENQ